MELLLKTMLRYFPELNRRPHGLLDVQKIAGKHKIYLKFAPYNDDVLGYFCVDRSHRKPTKHIVINDKLGPVMRDFVALHEVSHYFLHAPLTSHDWFYCSRNAKLTKQKYDCEADKFALVAMIPLGLLMELSSVDFGEIDPELLSFCIRRQRIYEDFGV